METTMNNNVIDEQRRKEELNHPNFRKWFNGLLKVTTIDLEFKKVNGEIRKMRCTLDEQFIPDDKKSTGNGNRKVPQDSIAVFDLDKQDWRSFRYDSIIEFSGEVPEDYQPTPDPVYFEEDKNNE